MACYTFGELKKIVSPYAGRAGKCPADEEVSVFARQVMELLLYEGSDAAIRKLSILAHRGCISLPPEVAVPLKVRIDRRVAEVWDKWHSFASVQESFEKCYPAGDILAEEGTNTPLAYDLPLGGSIVAVKSVCAEDPDAHIIVQGYDTTGRQVFTPSSTGELVPGERLSLKSTELRYGQVTWGNITGIVKPKTKGYVTFWAVDPLVNKRQFLADWSPNETRPEYRKYKIVGRECPEVAHVSMLCRVKLRDTYSDNELTLFENSMSILLAAQRLQHEKNDQVDVANYKRQALSDILDKEAGYNKQSGKPLDVFHPLSGGAVPNIFGRGLRR